MRDKGTRFVVSKFRERDMAGKRPAYVIAEVEITDAAVFQEYVSKAVPTLAAANARIIARSKPHSKEGTAPVGEIVIVAFESLEDAHCWYSNSPYSNTIPIGQRSANTRLISLRASRNRDTEGEDCQRDLRNCVVNRS
jgi:uncharacterized protein (DUF1330 family)